MDVIDILRSFCFRNFPIQKYYAWKFKISLQGAITNDFELLGSKIQSSMPPCEEGFKNRTFNRYSNIFCFDGSRVVLSDGLGPDYINANYVSGYLRDKAYIMTQVCSFSSPLRPKRGSYFGASTGARAAHRRRLLAHGVAGAGGHGGDADAHARARPRQVRPLLPAVERAGAAERAVHCAPGGQERAAPHVPRHAAAAREHAGRPDAPGGPRGLPELARQGRAEQRGCLPQVRQLPAPRQRQRGAPQRLRPERRRRAGAADRRALLGGHRWRVCACCAAPSTAPFP